MEPQERRRFEDNRRTEQPARAHEERTHADDDAISQAEIWCTFPGTIEDQQLMLDEHGFGHHATRTAGTCESGDRHQEMEEQDRQVAHVTSLQDREIREMLMNFAIRQAQLARRTLMDQSRRWDTLHTMRTIRTIIRSA